MNEHEEKKAFFNHHAKKWDENSRDMSKVELMLRLLSIKQGERILDVGTGTGVLLPLLRQFTGEEHITAIDIAEKMIEIARQKAGNSGITFITGDVLTYPFNSEIFDHIICYSVFPHFEEKVAVLRRLRDILKPGGLLGILHSESRDQINRIHVHAGSHCIKGDHLPPVDRVANCIKDLKLNEEIRIDNQDMYMLCARK